MQDEDSTPPGDPEVSSSEPDLAEGKAWYEPLKSLFLFPVVLGAKAREDGILLKASALAFVTVLSLVPLLAAFSFFGASYFNQYEQLILQILTQVLPYSEETIIRQLNSFVVQAENIRGPGLLAFVLVTLLAFGTIEGTLNRIWNVSQNRPLRARLLSFTLLLFWGPLLIGATYSSLLFLSQRPEFTNLTQQSALVRTLPFAATLLGLTMLYWLVPYTAVRFESALAGGAVAALLLELLRQGFGVYIHLVRGGVSIVYGTLGLALFFMLSIELAWTSVLLGGEVAYVSQHFHTLMRIRRSPNPPLKSWIGLASLAIIFYRFEQGEPFTSLDKLAEMLRLPQAELRLALAPLLEDNFLRERGGASQGYLLATDPRRLQIDRLLSLYEPPSRNILKELPESLAVPLEELRARLLKVRLQSVGKLSLAELLEGEPPAGKSDEPRA